MKQFNLLAIALLAAATVGTTSCGNDDKAVNDPTDGKLSFASQVNDNLGTRATSGNTWDGREAVQVNVSGTVYTFGVATDGTLTSSTLYWKDYSSIDAFAWYPNAYSYVDDQSTGNGIQDADFIFAEKVSGITRSNWETSKLTFKHKTAKVNITIEAGSGVTDVSGATVKIYGYTEVDAIDNTGSTPTGAITGKTGGWITPGNANTVLLLPITITNGNIFEVELGADKYYYKGTYTFEAGKSYQFTVKVTKGSLTIASNNIQDWDSPVTETVSAE